MTDGAPRNIPDEPLVASSDELTVDVADEPVSHLADDPGFALAEGETEDLEDGLTHDPLAASDSGVAYAPPIDPPTGLEDDGDPTFAAGFGGDADPSAARHRTSESPAADDVAERVRELLGADSLGSEYVDQLEIAARDGVVRVRGVVEDLDVQDHLLGVVAEVPGVIEVRDELRLPAG
jgi:hypothetical protein